MTQVIGNDELPNNGNMHRFEGYLYGEVGVSLFLSDTAPGKGPDLHKHPDEEVFVVQEGELTFTVGDDTIEATGGHQGVGERERSSRLAETTAARGLPGFAEAVGSGHEP